MRFYLDACCLSRLTNDQLQPGIRDEAEAIEQIVAKVRLGIAEMISSEAIDDEVRRTPSMEQRIAAETLVSLASSSFEVNASIERRERTEYRRIRHI